MMNLPVRMARWSARRPWRAIAAWFLFVIVCLGAGLAVGGHAATSADFRVGEAGRAEAMAEEGGLQRKPLERVLITAQDGGRQAAGMAETAARDVTARMKGLAEVESVAPPVRSADGRSPPGRHDDEGPGTRRQEACRTAARADGRGRQGVPGLRVDESGSPSISKDVQGQRGEDLTRTELIALPVTLIVLLLVFRSRAMALVPVLLAVTSIVSAIGLSMLASHAFPDAGAGANVILLIGMAVGVDYHHRRGPGAETAVTGEVARYIDYPEHQNTKMPMVFGALLLATFAITVWAFRSVMLGLIGVVLNLLSAAAALGLLTLVFQGSWAEGLLGFTSMGSIGSRVPLFLFVILFGLSMDYQVFVLSRIKEAVDGGVPTRQAVLDGTRRSAGVVTGAALVMVTVFASFIPLHLIEMKQFGFSLAVGVLLDAFVIRLVILPAALMLLGERTWWPRPGVRPAERDAGTGRVLQNVG